MQECAREGSRVQASEVRLTGGAAAACAVAGRLCRFRGDVGAAVCSGVWREAGRQECDEGEGNVDKSRHGNIAVVGGQVRCLAGR